MASLENLEHVDHVRALFANLELFLRAGIDEGTPLKDLRVGCHACIIGGSGTGKTSIINCLAQFYYDLGVVNTSEVVAVSAYDLMGRNEHEGARKVQEFIQSAIGGVLAIDEIGALYPRKDSYAGEVLTTLLELSSSKELKNNLVFVFTDYDERNIDRIIEIFPAFSFRFDKHRIILPPWSGSQALQSILRRVEQSQLRITKEAEDALFYYLQIVSQLPGWSSALDVLHMIWPKLQAEMAWRRRRDKAAARAASVAGSGGDGGGGGKAAIKSSGGGGGGGEEGGRTSSSISAVVAALSSSSSLPPPQAPQAPTETTAITKFIAYSDVRRVFEPLIEERDVMGLFPPVPLVVDEVEEEAKLKRDLIHTHTLEARLPSLPLPLLPTLKIQGGGGGGGGGRRRGGGGGNDDRGSGDEEEEGRGGEEEDEEIDFFALEDGGVSDNEEVVHTHTHVYIYIYI